MGSITLTIYYILNFLLPIEDRENDHIYSEVLLLR